MTATSYLSTEPVTLSELARRMRVPRRDAERAVQEWRLAGVAVVSDANGVRLAASASEVAECAAALRRRAINQLLTARALRRTAAQMTMAEGEFEAIPLW